MRFIGCSTYHRRGQSVCPNSLTVPMEQAEMEVLESLQASLLEPRIWSRALDYAVATLTGVDPRSAIDRLEGDVQRVDTELARLAGAVAHGGDLPPLLPCNASTTG